MHTMRYGPTMKLVTNTKKSNKGKETVMKKLQSFKAPPIILAATNKIEKAVADWYAKHSKKKLMIQTQPEPLEIYPAPPVINMQEEK